MADKPLHLTVDGDHVLPVQGLTEVPGFWPGVWGLLALVLETLLKQMDAWPLPDWIKPWLPVVIIVGGTVVQWLRNKSVAAKSVWKSPANVVPAIVTPNAETGLPSVEVVQK